MDQTAPDGCAAATFTRQGRYGWLDKNGVASRSPLAIKDTVESIPSDI